MPVAELARPGQRPYTPHGAAETLLYCRDNEVILEGPADTGKSRACLEKLHICMSKYPGSRALIVRKTRKSLTDSALVTFEERVLPQDSPIKNGAKREQRHSYRYPNGSEIVIGGLDDADKVMSMEFDMVYVQEAREILESDWEKLRARCRWGAMPYWQMIGDTNPDAPRHWIKLRGNRGQLTLLPSRHKDNPTFTPERQAILDGLTGVRRARLRDGLWVAAEGIVYEQWDRERHVVKPYPIPADWWRGLTLDFGWNNPLVCQWWALTPDGQLVMYRELYQTHLAVEDAAHEIRRLSEGERFSVIVCDHDAEDRATLGRHLRCGSALDCPRQIGVTRIGCGTTAARKDVTPGIEAVQKRLRGDDRGRPRLVLFEGARANPADERLMDDKLPLCTEEEVENYIWDKAAAKVNPDGTLKADTPLKKDDHGQDAKRYMVAYFDLGAQLGESFTKGVPFDRGTRPQGKTPQPVQLPGAFPKIKWDQPR